jgi:hypothetical protein
MKQVSHFNYMDLKLLRGETATYIYNKTTDYQETHERVNKILRP